MHSTTTSPAVSYPGFSRGGPGHLKSHLDYISRNGRLQAEAQDGRKITDRAELRALHDDWLLANAADQRGKPSPNAAQSVAIILSMPPGTPPDRVEAAARTWARETFGAKYDWLMARHDDTEHPHVHVTVRAVGRDGCRLAPGPDNLQQWRERFARELRRLGVEAEATPRQARGHVRKQRGVVLHVRLAERREAEREARAPKPPQPRDWSRDIQARQDSIRRAYLGHADELAKGDAADRRLANDIRRFVADMPVALTRRHALAVELRRVLERHPGRGAPTPSQAIPSGSEGLRRGAPTQEPQQTPPGLSRPRGRS